MAYTSTLPADGNYDYPVTLTAPEGWVPAGYHATTCEACGEVTELYSITDPRVVHRATGWAMCTPDEKRV